MPCRDLTGVQQAQVNFGTEKATVHFDPGGAVDRPAISRKIEASRLYRCRRRP